MGRHSWQHADDGHTCAKCGLKKHRGSWGPLFVRDGKSAQGEFAGDRTMPNGQSVAAFRTPPCEPSVKKDKGGQA